MNTGRFGYVPLALMKGLFGPGAFCTKPVVRMMPSSIPTKFCPLRNVPVCVTRVPLFSTLSPPSSRTGSSSKQL